MEGERGRQKERRKLESGRKREVGRVRKREERLILSICNNLLFLCARAHRPAHLAISMFKT